MSRRRPSDGGSFESKKEAERVYTWEADVVPRLSGDCLAYGAAHCYAKDALLEHTAFGKGLVTKVEGTKIEVLFQAGAKKLVHNPKGGEAPKAGAQAPAAAPVAAAPAPVAAASVPAAEPAPAAAPEPAASPAQPVEPPKT